MSSSSPLRWDFSLSLLVAMTLLEAMRGGIEVESVVGGGLRCLGVARWGGAGSLAVGANLDWARPGTEGGQ